VRTVHDVARQQLAALCGALEMAPARIDVVEGIFDGLAEHCADQPLDRPPRWSGMTDDCSPVEWSIGFGRAGPELRVLVEAQRDPASVATYWEASRGLTRWVVDDLDGDDAVVAGIIDELTPTDPDAYAAAYHGIELRRDGSVRTKVYLNPAAAGDRWTVAGAVLDRLGLTAQKDLILSAVGPVNLALIAFDLEPADRARVKLYVRSSSLDVLGAVADLCETPGSADHRPFVVGLYGSEVLGRQPWLAVHLAAAAHASVGQITRPTRAVLSLPVYESETARPSTAERIAALLAAHDLDAAAYDRAVAALAAIRPAGVPTVIGSYGMHSWVSFQREPDGHPRITVYFRLRAFAPRYGWLGTDPIRTWPCPIDTSTAGSA